MTVKIRMTRHGAPQKPTFRLVVADSREALNSAVIEILGSYNPRRDPPEIKLDEERILYWLKKGAQPTNSARELLKSQGVWQKYLNMKENKQL